MQKAKDLLELPHDISIIGDQSPLPPQQLEILRELAYRRAASDPVFFLENFWSVIDPESMKWVPFKLRDYQLEDVEWLAGGFSSKRWRAIIGKARQVGQTTLLAGMAAWDMLFHDNHPWLISSQTDEDAKNTLTERLKTPYLMLPEWFKSRAAELLDDNSEQMTFSNGSRVLSVPSTSRAGRGKVVFGVVMDEAAHAEKAQDVFTALDPMAYGPLILVSTGNGMGNFFHETWVDSQRHDTAWESRFHPWSVVPGRDKRWYNNEKRKYRGREHIFYQEMPATPEEQFAKTGLAVLPIDLLRDEQDWKDPEYKIDLDLHWQNFRDWETPVEAELIEEGDEAPNELWVWEWPTVERDPDKGFALRPPNYVIFSDTAEGLVHNDRTSITVMNANTLEEAASYRGWWPIEDLGELLNYLGRWYYNALILPERNNQGILPIEQLRKNFGYPRLHRMGQLASIPKGEKTPRYGWVTTKATKPKMVHEFIKGLRDGHIALHDVRFLEEAATFIRHDNGAFAASGENYDDHVISHLGAWQGALMVDQYPVVWEDTEGIRPVTWGEMIEWDDEEEVDILSQPIGQDPPTAPKKTWIVTR